MQHLKALIIDEKGATAIEYGLLAAFIASGIMTTVMALAGKIMGIV